MGREIPEKHGAVELLNSDSYALQAKSQDEQSIDAGPELGSQVLRSTNFKLGAIRYGGSLIQSKRQNITMNSWHHFTVPFARLAEAQAHFIVLFQGMEANGYDCTDVALLQLNEHAGSFANLYLTPPAEPIASKLVAQACAIPDLQTKRFAFVAGDAENRWVRYRPE